MHEWSRRGFIAGAGAGAGAFAALVGAGGARARTHRSTPGARTLDIVTGEDGFSVPETAVAGAVGFRLRTTSPLTGAVGLARLRRGATEAQFRTRLRRVFATEGQENIEASRELMATAELYGGGLTHVGTDTGGTLELRPGRHLVLEYLDFQGDRGRNPVPGQEYVRTLTVHDGHGDGHGHGSGDESEGRDGGDGGGRHRATLTAVESPGPGGGARFVLRGEVRRGRPVRYVNAMRGQVDEAVFYPITEDSVTEEDIQAFFDGTNPSLPFDMVHWLGTPPLSSGRSAILNMPLMPGRYAAVSWVTSVRDARPLGAHGQHRIVTVR